MYIYNVTTNVDESIHDHWLNWMKSVHIPAMLATGKFSSAKMSKVLIDEEMGGETYAVQYATDSMETLNDYYENDSTKLQNESIRLFGEKTLDFRTELKVIAEQFSISVNN